MKPTISLQLSLCLERVTNDSKDEIRCTVLLLHQIKEEMNEWLIYQRGAALSDEDSNQERILQCSMMYGCAGCSRPTYVQSSSMCNNEKFRCKLSCKTVTMAEVTSVSLQVRLYVRSFVWLVRSVDPFEQFALDSFDSFDLFD